MIDIKGMTVDYIIRQLDLNKVVFEQLLKVKSQEEAVWKPDPDKWCILEVLCHLVDEEVYDFRARVGTCLDPKAYPLKSIDPVGWVKSRKYIEQDFEEKVAEWISEREKSLHWLQSLDNPDWQSHLYHVELGRMTALQFLANWLAHDHIHIRQILKVKHAYLAHISDQDLNYAGNW